MGVFQQAIEDGVQQDLYEAFAEKIEDLGDCYHEPQDRCVMRPKDGCACLYSRWQRLPWYQKMFAKKPVKPDVKHVMEAAMKLVTALGECTNIKRATQKGAITSWDKL